MADDSELIAVISAAVAMMMEDGSAFITVRRVRRVQNAPAWQKAGREVQVYSRFSDLLLSCIHLCHLLAPFPFWASVHST